MIQKTTSPAPERENRGQVDQGRRQFMERVGQAGMLTVAASPLLGARVLAQPAAVPPAPPGTVSIATVMADKDPVVKVLTERPLTASPTAEFLHDEMTPTARLFIRNNLLTPDLDASVHKLRVTGLVDRPLDLTLEELQRRFPNVTLQAMLECAGAGRTAFNPTPRGTPWPPTGGLGCPNWTGVRLKDVLAAAGVKSNAVHVAFLAADFGELPTAPPVVRSIPLSKAVEPNTLLAWGVNGAPLPKVHGYPLRALVPGWVGSASIKWLVGIEVLDAPFRGTYMDDSYRMPAYPVAPGERMPKETVHTEAWPVKSIITHPSPGATFRPGEPVMIAGRTWAGDFDVDRVEVSLDEGITWHRARLTRPRDKYAWRLFSYEWKPRKRGYVTALARARDAKGNIQPIVGQWNPLGYYWNGVHRVGFSIES